MTSGDCTVSLTKRHHECFIEHSLAHDEMGSAVLPSPAEEGCGVDYDPSVLNDVHALAEAGRFVDHEQCSNMAAQMICDISGRPSIPGIPDKGEPRAKTRGFLAGKGESSESVEKRRHNCYCSVSHHCTSVVLPQLAALRSQS